MRKDWQRPMAVFIVTGDLGKLDEAMDKGATAGDVDRAYLDREIAARWGWTLGPLSPGQEASRTSRQGPKTAPLDGGPRSVVQ